MVDTTTTPAIAGTDTRSDFVLAFNESVRKRHWRNLTNLTDADATVDVTLGDQLYNLTGATATVTLTLPPSDADSAGMCIFYYVSDATTVVTIARDGTDTINGAGADLTPAVNTSGELCSLGDGNWIHR